LSRLFWSVVVATMLALAGVAGVAVTRAATAAPTAKTPRCRAHLVFTASTVTAVPNAHCDDPRGYLMLSWAELSKDNNAGEHLFDSASAPPWTVKLPPCFWQVDFVINVAPPHRPVIAGKQGVANNCPPPATTTTTTTRAAPPPPPPTSTSATTAPEGVTVTTRALPRTTTVTSSPTTIHHHGRADLAAHRARRRPAGQRMTRTATTKKETRPCPKFN
jgi:hypothetical protein